jgi:hypothetical protein
VGYPDGSLCEEREAQIRGLKDSSTAIILADKTP